MKNTFSLFCIFLLLSTDIIISAPVTKTKLITKSKEKLTQTPSLTFSQTAGIGLKDFGHMITNLPKDEYSFFNKGLSENNLPFYIGLVGLTGALMQFDIRGWHFENRLYNSSNTFHNLANDFVFMGNGKFHFMLSGLFATYGLIFRNSKAISTAIKISEAVISSGLFVQVLKRITGRQSPAIAKQSKGHWHFFPSIDDYQEAQPNYYSFPSGHLCSAMATLTVIANQYPNVKWIKPVGYTILGAIGFSLVSKGMHWYSDLPLGLFIGYTFGNLIAPEHSNIPETTKDYKPQLSLFPSMGLHNFDLSMCYSF